MENSISSSENKHFSYNIDDEINLSYFARPAFEALPEMANKAFCA